MHAGGHLSREPAYPVEDSVVDQSLNLWLEIAPQQARQPAAPRSPEVDRSLSLLFYGMQYQSLHFVPDLRIIVHFYVVGAERLLVPGEFAHLHVSSSIVEAAVEEDGGAIRIRCAD